GLSTSSEQLQVGASASGEDVVLELLLDPNAFTVEAVYTVGTGTRTSLGTLSVPADYFTGRNIGGGDMSFAGIYNTHRSGTQFASGFDDFSVEEQVILDSDNDIVDFVLSEQTGNAMVDATSHTVSIEVAQGTDASSLVPTVTVSPNAVIDPQSGIAQDFSVPFNYTVTAQDGTPQQWTVNVTVSNPVLCSPISPLDCADVAVSLPY
ncbi:DUF5018 domain-containing protein, partial [uncultured Zobellia sp.]|uniref:DUF5018 domain-containing protein n=1 Tax=uncultured Zobellia sp. TaxID=255433 RepID=UPI002599EF84